MQVGREDLHRQSESMNSRFFHRPPGFAIVIFLLCVAAERSPAPIVETPDNPAPAPQQQPSVQKWNRPVKPKSEITTTTKESRQKPAMTGSARFAGAWSGVINQGFLGTIRVSFSINGEGTSVRMDSS